MEKDKQHKKLMRRIIKILKKTYKKSIETRDSKLKIIFLAMNLMKIVNLKILRALLIIIKLKKRV